MVKDDHEVGFLSYFTILDDLKMCGFNVLNGDKFCYLKPKTPISDLNGLVQLEDDDDVLSMLSSYKKCRISTFEIYTLSSKHDVLPNLHLDGEVHMDDDSSEDGGTNIGSEHNDTGLYTFISYLIHYNSNFITFTT
ncbi:unnamed protein product [Linum tenue]|uniref:Uncharacterized protein n=1 Tax=Linum tenue TaxID=586396 RepID=A0AAV0IT19_9ROSI|nr:unnamed protein product [Linum tenue]